MATRRERRQARTQGRLRYRPEQQGLQQLARQERRDLLDTTDSQNTAADAIVGSAREGRQDIAQIYEDAGLTDAVRGALDSNPAARRLAEEMAGAQVELRQREVDAREGASFAINQATTEYRRNIKDIRNRQVDLKRERGMFVSDLLQQLVGERQAAQAEAQQHAADQKFEIFKQDRQALLNNDIDPNTGKPLPGAKPKGKPKGKDMLTRGEQNTQAGIIQQAVAQAKRLEREGRSRAEAAKALTEGRPGTKVYVDRRDGKTPVGKNDPNAQEVPIPEVPSYRELYASIALDVAFFGRISEKNARLLREAGIAVKPLGYQFGPRQNQARPVGSNNRAPF